MPDGARNRAPAARARRINFRVLDEATSVLLWMRRWGGRISDGFAVFAEAVGKRAAAPDEAVEGIKWAFPEAFSRKRALQAVSINIIPNTRCCGISVNLKLVTIAHDLDDSGSCNEAQRGG